MFIEGWIFIIISLTGVRGRLVSLVPKSIMLATAGAAACAGTTSSHQQQPTWSRCHQPATAANKQPAASSSSITST